MKLSNILLTYENVAQIADFGLAKFKGLHTGFVGTKPYSAPETFDVKPSYFTASDIFAFGLMIYEAWYGDFYFEIDESFAKKGDDIAQQLKRNKRPQFKGNELSELFKLMTQSWAQDPDIRPSCDDCLKKLNTLRGNLKISGSTVPSPITDANFVPTFCDDLKKFISIEEGGNSELFSDIQNCPRFSKLSISSTE